ncbi:hypothetical protein ASF43_23370 [Pseudorhodoferax sp. Leaf267]|nr:hypothetical protein ASF43_23370 [Pseudorhodoferax sp. Leaf267]
MVSGHSEDALDLAAADFRNAQQPCLRCLVLVRMSLEGDVTPYKDDIDRRLVFMTKLSKVGLQSGSVRDVTVAACAQAIRFTEMNVGQVQ